ncbi:MAG: BrnT family toxin [Candidatus Gribaldobacteria bacterium]|nr:BrnT family toxin [Candidatus Gribaldobacteria bacterium]
MKRSKKIIQFDWDRGNSDKNWQSHKVSDGECEEVFFDPGKKILKDVSHSLGEERFILLGRTTASRILFIVFTVRNNKVRIISARDLNKKEKNLYEKSH